MQHHWGKEFNWKDFGLPCWGNSKMNVSCCTVKFVFAKLFFNIDVWNSKTSSVEFGLMWQGSKWWHLVIEDIIMGQESLNQWSRIPHNHTRAQQRRSTLRWTSLGQGNKFSVGIMDYQIFQRVAWRGKMFLNEFDYFECMLCVGWLDFWVCVHP